VINAGSRLKESNFKLIILF